MNWVAIILVVIGALAAGFLYDIRNQLNAIRTILLHPEVRDDFD